MNKNKIAIITDSSADLRQDFIDEHGIYILPLRVLCNDGEYLDGINIKAEDVYRRLKSGELPKTSLPSGESLASVIKKVQEDGYTSAVAIMMSSGLSGTYNLLALTEEDFAEMDKSPFKLKAFDTKSGSVGEGLMVMQATLDIENGVEWDELVNNKIPHYIKNTHAFFTLDTLEYLQKGGRIGKVAAIAGTLMQIKPILSFDEETGQLMSVEKVRGKKLVIPKLIELIDKYGAECKSCNLGVVHGGMPEGMEQVKELLLKKYPQVQNIWDGEIDSTLSVYIGDGVVGAIIQVLE